LRRQAGAGRSPILLLEYNAMDQIKRAFTFDKFQKCFCFVGIIAQMITCQRAQYSFLVTASAIIFIPLWIGAVNYFFMQIEN
jgi:hypothetical protein